MSSFTSIFFKHLYWSIIALQLYVSFCFITKWISYTYTICSHFSFLFILFIYFWGENNRWFYIMPHDYSKYELLYSLLFVCKLLNFLFLKLKLAKREYFSPQLHPYWFFLLRYNWHIVLVQVYNIVIQHLYTLQHSTISLVTVFHLIKLIQYYWLYLPSCTLHPHDIYFTFSVIL